MWTPARGSIIRASRRRTSPLQAQREPACLRGHGVFAAIERERQPHQQQHRLPLIHQRFDAGEPHIIGLCVDGSERMGDAELQFPHRDADASFTEIEGQHRTGTKISRFENRFGRGVGLRNHAQHSTFAVGSRMTGLLREAGRIEPEQFHRCDKTLG